MPSLRPKNNLILSIRLRWYLKARCKRNNRNSLLLKELGLAWVSPYSRMAKERTEHQKRCGWMEQSTASHACAMSVKGIGVQKKQRPDSIPPTKKKLNYGNDYCITALAMQLRNRLLYSDFGIDDHCNASMGNPCKLHQKAHGGGSLLDSRGENGNIQWTNTSSLLQCAFVKSSSYCTLAIQVKPLTTRVCGGNTSTSKHL